MSFKITLNYREETYTSELFDDEELDSIAGFIEDVVTGKAQHLAFVNGDHKYYFPLKVLNESIITITKNI